MKEADRQTIEVLGLPGAVLMEVAGQRVAQFIIDNYNFNCHVTVAAGPGNNGGDGMVIARVLLQAGFSVSVWSTVRQEAYRGDAAINREFLDALSLPVKTLLTSADLEPFKTDINKSGLIVDALLGVGVNREVSGLMADVIGIINDSGATPVLAVDIPSGVSADDGLIKGCAVRADYTITFAFPKYGLMIGQGAEIAGKVYVAEINIPPFLAANQPVELVTIEKVTEALPVHGLNTHKGSRGKALLVAGSGGMCGAAVLAAQSAIRGGAGLVYLAAPESACAVLEAKLTEPIIIALPEKEPGILDHASIALVLEKASECNALAIGPGLKPHPSVFMLIEKVIAASQVPVVLDAGALEALAAKPEVLKGAGCPVVVTPHPGEMGRLAGKSTADIQKNRLSAALEYAVLWNAVLLLKGFNSIIALPDGRAFINPTGGPGLATAGSGDLLTGLIVSLIAQGLTAEEAAVTGAFIHGLAGDLTGHQFPSTAGDILENYQDTFRLLDKLYRHPEYNQFLRPLRPL